MAKISNSSIYGFDNPVSGKDYLIGTDGNPGSGKITKNYKIENIAEYINVINGNSSMAFRYSEGIDITITNATIGYFFSNSNETDPSLVNKLFINNKNLESKDINLLFQTLVQSNLLLLKLTNASDKRNIIYLNIGLFVQHLEYFELSVSLFENLSNGVLENLGEYSFSFEIAKNVENKLTSLGTVSKTGNQIDLTTNFKWTIGGFNYENSVPYSTTIPNATAGNKRIDVLVGNIFNGFDLIQGNESNSIALEPIINVNSVKIFAINIFGNDVQIEIPTIDPKTVRQLGYHNVLTNNPNLSDSFGKAGDEWIISVGGTRNYGSGNITLGESDLLAHDGVKYFKKFNNNQTPQIKRSFICQFFINQNVASSANWYRKDSATGFNGNYTIQTGLSDTNNFSSLNVQTPCYTLPFKSKIKKVHARGWSNISSTSVQFAIVRSKETEPNLPSTPSVITNPLIIAKETILLSPISFVNGFNKTFDNASLNTVTLDENCDIRLLFTNNNVNASNMFDTVITVEFEEVF